MRLTKEELEWVRKHRKRITLLSEGLIGLFLAMIIGAIGYFTIPYINPIGWFLLIMIIFGFVLLLVGVLSERLPFIVSYTIFAVIFIMITFNYYAGIYTSRYYNVSIQVFYPNHPNITITQHCTPFNVSASTYLNSQPVNPKNTTICILPQEDNNTATCYITNSTIECKYYPLYNETVDIWKGKILNISKG